MSELIYKDFMNLDRCFWIYNLLFPINKQTYVYTKRKYKHAFNKSSKLSSLESFKVEEFNMIIYGLSTYKLAYKFEILYISAHIRHEHIS